MNWKSLRLLPCLAALLAATAFAEDNSSELVEKVAVRNRLYSTSSRFELGLNVGFSLLPRINEHYNLNASAAYNLADWLAIELRVGYALSRTTSLGEQMATEFYKNTSVSTASNCSTTGVCDAADAWRMGFNSVAGLRFQPIYGKINLMGEVPVHFQFYLWVGGGVGLFNKTSTALCLYPKTATSDPGKCVETVHNADGSSSEVLHPENFMNESKVGPLVSLALGFRFFINNKHGIKLEVRDFSYLDSYYVDIHRDQVSTANPTGGGRLSPNAGISNLVQIDLGYAFVF